jgi:purine-binding chemotaxis protein CheW
MIGSTLPDSDQERLLVTFCAGESAYGLDATRVQEVVLVGVITAVYHAPPEVRGIINLRGKIITVIGLNEKLSNIETEIGANSRILITLWADEYVGLLVDCVGEVLTMESGQVEACPANMPDSLRRFVTGVYRNADGAVAILNLETLLT